MHFSVSSPCCWAWQRVLHFHWCLEFHGIIVSRVIHVLLMLLIDICVIPVWALGNNVPMHILYVLLHIRIHFCLDTYQTAVELLIHGVCEESASVDCARPWSEGCAQLSPTTSGV